MTVDLDKAVVCRLRHSGKIFEIMVDPKKALDFKKGSDINMKEILAYPSIYKNVSTTDVVAEDDLQKVFGTTDVFEIAEKIIKNGDLQLTTEQKKNMRNNKKKQIIELISRRGVNPQTDTPHPPKRIENAIDKAGVKIDPFKDAESQLDEIVKALKTFIPITFQRATVSIRVQPQYAGRVYSVLKDLGNVKKEQWLNDGSLNIEIEVLGGLQQELFDRMAKLTHGNFESKVVRKEEI